MIRDGRMFPRYVTPHTWSGTAGLWEFAEPWVKKHHAEHGIWEALKLMNVVWDAVIARHAAKGAVSEERIAQGMDLPESMLSFIRESGACGKPGSVKRAEDYLRNVIALSHFEFARLTRKPKTKKGVPVQVDLSIPSAREFYFLTPKVKGAIPMGWDAAQTKRMGYELGGMNWAGASRIINDFCRLLMPEAAGFSWKEFTGNSLKTLYEDRGLWCEK